MRNSISFRSQARGVTLMELIVAIVVIGVALAGVLVVFLRNTSASVDPLLTHQAAAIAEAYLEEALTKNFTDPDGTNLGESRETYDNVLDYNFTDNGARDQNDSPISGLGNYTVQIQAVAAVLNTIPNTAAIQVTVTVTPTVSGGAAVVLSGYRTDY